MKRKKRIWSVLVLATVLIFMQLPVSEADAAASASDFKMEGSTLVKYQGTEKNVSIPNTVETIGRGAFEENKNIELVVVPNSVKNIEPYAFWGCDNLDTVVLGKGLEAVGDYAFAGCKGLVQMSIPSNVTTIGIQAFGDCVNLKDISIPPETGTIHETAFDGCVVLTIHCDPGSKAEEFAEGFYERQKKMPGYGTETPPPSQPSVPDMNTPAPSPGGTPDNTPEPEPEEPPAEIPQGSVLGTTQVVGNMAVVFADSHKLKVLGGGVQSGENGPDENSGAGGDSADPENQGEASGDEKTVLLEDVFGDTWSGSLPKYAVIDGVTVADQAYYRSQLLDTMVLPEEIREIGQFSFARSSLTSIILPKGTETIGYGAFYHCSLLSDIILPDTIKCVEPKAFEHTLWVKRFMEDSSESDFLVEGGVLVAYRGTAAEVSIPQGVRVIAGEVFLNHEEIESLVLPDSLQVIGEGAFEGCSSLSKITFGKNVEEIKDRAFKGNAMSEVVVPASVKKLGLQAFGNSLMTYAYGEPEYTYETSAGRLSNEAYRDYGRTEEQKPGVTVTGVDGISAAMEGADKHYVLNVVQSEDTDRMGNAFRRTFGKDISQDLTGMVLYDFTLTDESNIPLTKLGSQVLTVMVPVPESLKGQTVRLFALDRNGQLEILPAEEIKVEGMDFVQFKTTSPSLTGICGVTAAF